MKAKYFIVFFLLSCGQNCDVEFSSRRWKLNPDFRYLMVQDLIESNVLKNFSEDEIVSLLGKPYRSNKEVIIYSLGIPRGGIKAREPIYFIIESQSGKVFKFYVNPDPSIDTTNK